MKLDIASIRRGDILLFARKRWAILPPGDWALANAIRRRTDGAYHHAAVVYSIKPVTVIEAHYPRVRHVPLTAAYSPFSTNVLVVRHEQMTDEACERGMIWLRTRVGAPYDLNAIDAMRRAYREGGSADVSHVRGSLDDEHTICSELAVAFVAQCGLAAYPGIDGDPTTPATNVPIPSPTDIARCPLYPWVTRTFRSSPRW